MTDSNSNDIDMVEIDTTLPLVVQKFLASGARLESIKIDSEGRWWHEGGLFNNERISELFSRSIGRTEGGTWFLEVGPFTYPIEVEDTAFFVRSAVLTGGGPEDTSERVSIKLSDGTSETLDCATLSHSEGRGFSCLIKAGAYKARFGRSAFYTLTERLLETDDGGFALRIGGSDHPV